MGGGDTARKVEKNMKYEIWQLKKENLRAYGFMDYEWAKEHGFDFDDYEKVYEGEIETGRYIEGTLDNVFIKFNTHRPEGFKGHSLSMSDIVVLNGEKFYCDTFGWKNI